MPGGERRSGRITPGSSVKESAVGSGWEEGKGSGSTVGRWEEGRGAREGSRGRRPREKLCSGDELNILLIVFVCLNDLFHLKQTNKKTKNISVNI